MSLVERKNQNGEEIPLFYMLPDLKRDVCFAWTSPGLGSIAFTYEAVQSALKKLGRK